MRHSERINDLVERLQAIRDSVGWDCDIGVEIHRNMTPGDSIVLAKEIEHIRPYFFDIFLILFQFGKFPIKLGIHKAFVRLVISFSILSSSMQ